MLLTSTIIAPDTSHWANWIDAALGGSPAARQTASDFHERLLREGRVPLLSWHHLEELLVVDDPASASARVSFIQSLPMIAWMQTPGEQGLGGIIDILAAEAVAYDAGCHTLAAVRDHVRPRLLRTGSGSQAIGQDGWVWDVARPAMRKRRPHVGMLSALSGMRTMDELQTVGQLSRQTTRSPEERRQMMSNIHRDAFVRVKAADPDRTDGEAFAMADEFVRRVLDEMPTMAIPVRQLLVETYGRQGVDEDEVRDDCTIAELSELATFRTQLRIVAAKTRLPFERLKQVRMECLPSWRISTALRKHGQKRRLMPSSDVHDQHLAVLAAYTDELFVDKRTHEDFRRLASKEPYIAQLFGAVRKASRFEHVAELLSG